MSLPFKSFVTSLVAVVLTLSRAVLTANAPAYGTYHAPWYAIGSTKTPFATKSGTVFTINGKHEYFMGINAWWVSRLRKDADIDTVLNEISSSNVKVVRAWAYATFNFTPPVDYGNMYGTWFQLLNSSGTYVNYGANGLARLDYLVHAAEQRNLSLVLPMVDYNSGLGGIDLYQNALGCNATQWYDSVPCQNAYRSYVQTLVARYKSSPAIFAWEIMNEPRCELCPTSVITNWANRTSAWVKTLDSKHMVVLGDEGWFGAKDGIGDGNYPYTGSEGVDWVDIMKIPTIDYGTVHCYPDSYGYPDSWGSTWITQHAQFAAKIGKPVVIEEYGSHYGPSNHSGVAGWQQTILNSNIGMDCAWDFSTPDLSVGVPYSDSATLFYNDTANYNLYVKQHAAKMLAKKVT